MTHGGLWWAATLLALSAACASGGAADAGRGSTGPNGTPADGGPDAPVGAGGPDAAGGDAGGQGPVAIDVMCPPLAMPARPATIYVDASATGVEEGTKAAPFRTLAKAIESAGPEGVVWAATGTYAENLVIPDKDLAIHGGFVSGFTARTDACATVIEAADPSLPVLSASFSVGRLTIDGVTVRKGARGLSVDGDATVQATFTITSCVFADNGLPGEVGGGALLDSVNAVVRGSVFRDNRAAKGAALASGGNVTLTVEDSLFERNIGHSDHGGAVYASPKMATIVRNTFRGNEIGKGLGYGWGGAVVVFKAGADPVKADLAYNFFTDNLAGIGGAVFVDDGAQVTMSHDLVVRNRSYPENGVVRGAALYVDGAGGSAGGSTLTGDHLTVVNNAYDDTGAAAASTLGGAVYVELWSKATFTSSILWNNGEDALYADATSAIEVRYAIAPGACAGPGACTLGEGVLQPPDAHFVDEAADDYHVKSTAGHYHEGEWVKDEVTSPAVDAADPAEGAASEPAPNGGRPNLGVYGRTAEASKSP